MQKIIKHICDFIFGKHKSNTLPRVWILAVDMVIVIFTYVMANIMIYFNYFPNVTVNWNQTWLLPLFYLVAFLISRTYDGMLRYSGFNDIRKIIISCSYTLVALILTKLLFV